MNGIKLASIFIMLLLVGLVIYTWITYFDLKEKGPEIAKCYDRHNNEIIGAECIDDNDTLYVPVFITMLSLLMIVIFSMAMPIMDL